TLRHVLLRHPRKQDRQGDIRPAITGHGWPLALEHPDGQNAVVGGAGSVRAATLRARRPPAPGGAKAISFAASARLARDRGPQDIRRGGGRRRNDCGRLRTGAAMETTSRELGEKFDRLW